MIIGPADTSSAGSAATMGAELGVAVRADPGRAGTAPRGPGAEVSTRRMDDTGLDRIAQFARQEIGPYLAAHPEDRYPLPLVRQLAQLGAFGAAVPTQYGGGDWSRRDLALIGYELGRGWQPLAALVGTHLKLCRQVTQHGTPRQRERWLDAMARGESVFARAYHEQGIGHPPSCAPAPPGAAGPPCSTDARAG